MPSCGEFPPANRNWQNGVISNGMIFNRFKFLFAKVWEGVQALLLHDVCSWMATVQRSMQSIPNKTRAVDSVKRGTQGEVAKRMTETGPCLVGSGGLDLAIFRSLERGIVFNYESIRNILYRILFACLLEPCAATLAGSRQVKSENQNAARKIRTDQRFSGR